MIFGIDYDGTFSEDPDFFLDLITLMKAYGHQAVIVTQRSSEWDRHDVDKNVNGKIPVVFAGEKWKNVAAKEEGYDVDVWIDDSYEFNRELFLLRKSILH